MGQNYIAEPGKVWVCGACGRYGPDRSRIGDESCFLNAVLCWEKSLTFKAGMVVGAEAVDDAGE